MNSDYSISTAWNYKPEKPPQRLIAEIKNAGFSKLELNFAISKDYLKELTDVIHKEGIHVTSVHNYCPVPEEIKGKISPDYFSISSLKETEKEKAVEYTKETIDTAMNLGAKVVVLHSGRVEMGDCYSRKLIRLYKEGKAFGDEYKQTIFEMTEKRKGASGSYLNAAIESIKELSKYARKKGIDIGLETRYYYREIPQFEEFEKIFEAVHEPNLFYWHDVGHAQCAQNLGIVSHVSYLKRYSYRMLGIHIHDTKGTDDHRLPTEGETNFKIIKPYLNPNILKVFEPHPPVDVQRLRESIDYFENSVNSVR